MTDAIPIPVVCAVFPDGTVHWIPNPTHELIRACVEEWKETLEQERRDLYARSGVVGGFIELQMFARDIPAPVEKP